MKLKAIAMVTSVFALAWVAFGQQADGFRRERSGETGAQKDALEGKPPPAFHLTNWMNLEGEKAPTWAELKGKVVLLDFWAHW